MKNRVELVAEMSANHGQSIEIAKQTIKAAKEAGADAVKIQSYTADTLTIDCDNEFFRIAHGTIWDGTTLYKLYQEAYTPWEWHQELFEYAKKVGIEIFSTPFDYAAVDLLEELNVRRYKIASPEITDIPLIEYVASKGKPIVISNGIATLEEISEAVDACRRKGNEDITLLQCISQYPARPEDSNLLVMRDMKERFRVKVGLSDHSIGYEAAVIASAMQVAMIEKHFIIDRKIGGPDSSFSMSAEEFKKMVSKIRRVESIIGEVTYEFDEKKRKSREFARSLFVVQDVRPGEKVTSENVRSIRPGHGISPKYISDICGQKFSFAVKKGTPFSWEMISFGKESEDQ
ncbi:MAG: pseudaminic acid synthase [Syntrophomonadaceae bacterium]|nr:pseudaminic acid synthase [Syntrophomonadaceae bacterium]